MHTIKDEYRTLDEAIEVIANSISQYWTDCDLIEKRDDPKKHVPEMVKFHAELLCKEYDEEGIDNVSERLYYKAKREYLKNISKIEGTGNE